MAASAPAEVDLRALAPAEVPLALADLHASLRPDDEVLLRFPVGAPPARTADLAVGAGFDPHLPRPPVDGLLGARRAWSLPDTVGADMRVLVCGLNPSPTAADTGVGYSGPANRFWPAALAAGLVTHDRDPRRALSVDGVGMTDLVKRTTPRAAELATAELRDGTARVERLCAWLAPRIVCVVGLAGWRAAVDRSAVAGPQDRTLGGRPVHLVPSTSGLNARTRLDELVDHLRAVAAAVA